jgi:hypothetical protein
MCTQASEKNSDCISISDNDAINSTNLARLSDDVEAAGCSYESKRCFGTRTRDFKR